MGRRFLGIPVSALMALVVGCGAHPTSADVAGDEPDWVDPPPAQGAPAPGEPLHHSAGVELTVPLGWAVQPWGEHVQLLSPDRAAVVRLMVIDTGQLEVALDGIDRQLDGQLEAHDLGSVRTAVVNGLKARLAAGSGWLKGESVKLRIALLLTPRKQVLVLLSMIRQNAVAERQAEIRGLLESIRPGRLSRP